MKKNYYWVFGIVVMAGVLFWAASMLYTNTSQSKDSKSADTRADASLLIRDYSPSIGPLMARVTIVEFLDPECESCRAMHPIIKSILKDYEGRVRYVVRYMPFHDNSALAAQWLEAAREQNKYWETLDVLFEHQPQWGDHHAPRPELIPQFVASAGVDIQIAQEAIKNPEFERRIKQDADDGEALGVRATPTVFVNGKALDRLGDSGLRALIDSEL